MPLVLLFVVLVHYFVRANVGLPTELSLPLLRICRYRKNNKASESVALEVTKSNAEKQAAKVHYESTFYDFEELVVQVAKIYQHI